MKFWRHGPGHLVEVALVMVVEKAKVSEKGPKITTLGMIQTFSVMCAGSMDIMHQYVGSRPDPPKGVENPEVRRREIKVAHRNLVVRKKNGTS